MKIVFFFFGILSLSFPLFSMELNIFLDESLKQNPGIEKRKYEMQSEEANVSVFATLEDPMIGWMKEGDMRSWTLSQNLKFPLKYKIFRDIQKTKWETSRSNLSLAQWEYREKILSSLFKYDFLFQNIKFIEAQKNNLKEALKLMTSRRASGGVKQQEELRSYLEQTKLETQLLIAQQMYEETKAELIFLVGNELFKNLPANLSRPKIVDLDNLHEVMGPELKMALSNLQSVKIERTLARLEYFPDFKLTTKQPLKKNEGNSTYALEMSIPLWFLGKQNSINESASAKFFASEKEYELKKIEQNSNIQKLISKIQNMDKLLQLYESSLLPQAQSSFQSNLGSYRIGGVTFLNVVEAQRLFYEEKMVYLENTLKYIAAILELEKILGKTISNFPEGKI